ncbi:glycosyltransferase family 2 protein [Paenibacillus timonensis]|uniref:Glycosyltransferase family 2 protein n=1 Tax=Paenibacillus timonensis TaxID=225915 RepID=A0ABW3SG50_9BACL|nr:glycosyltransferase family 2 protein [Paenibacillus timonensis]MCH1642345.1 glycosyltransferase family 2 protein [Paenibacillus timonensis]
MDKPNFLILLSTYNGEKYLTDQINSLLAQEDINFHLLIRDDGSKDATIPIIKTFIRSISGKITLMEAKNVGAKNSFFELIKQSANSLDNYDFFAFCDQDDIWKKQKLCRAANLLSKESPNLPLMYCSSTQMVDSELNKLRIWPNTPKKPLTVYNALVENVAVGCTTVLNGRALEMLAANLPSNLNHVIMHDWWAYLTVSALGRVIFDSEPSIHYRQHSNNVLGGQSDNWITKWRRRFWRYFKGQNHFILSNQAKEFLARYKSLLDQEIQKDVQDFINSTGEAGLSRFTYAMKTPFYRQSSADQRILKLLISLGKV